METTFAAKLYCGVCEPQLSCGCSHSSFIAFCGGDAGLRFTVRIMPKDFLGDVSSLAQVSSSFSLMHVFCMSSYV